MKCDYCNRKSAASGGVIGIVGKERRNACKRHIPIMLSQQDFDIGLEQLKWRSEQFAKSRPTYVLSGVHAV